MFVVSYWLRRHWSPLFYCTLIEITLWNEWVFLPRIFSCVEVSFINHFLCTTWKFQGELQLWQLNSNMISCEGMRGLSQPHLGREFYRWAHLVVGKIPTYFAYVVPSTSTTSCSAHKKDQKRSKVKPIFILCTTSTSFSIEIILQPCTPHINSKY